MCLAFDTLPSQLHSLFWKISFNDLRFQQKQYYGKQVVYYTQHLEVLGYVVSRALGGSEDKPKPTQNVAEAQAQLGAIFG